MAKSFASAGKGKNRIDNIGNRVKDRGEFGVQTRTRISRGIISLVSIFINL